MEIEYDLALPPFDAGTIEALVALSGDVFGQRNPEYLTWRISHMPDVSMFHAAHGGAMVGFKLGYAMTQRKYYSWLGGVRSDLRGQGIASQLMVRQHEWLAERGYTLIETAIDQDNHAMARANQRHGFSVCGMRVEPSRTQILFLKSLG